MGNKLSTSSQQQAGCSYLEENEANNLSAGASSCPVPEQARNQAVYNVYSQRINDPNAPSAPNPLAALSSTDMLDPKNNMPLEANQQPCPGQRRPLSVDRMHSTIPKGGTESTWVYPSPQMFFNGKRRHPEAYTFAGYARCFLSIGIESFSSVTPYWWQWHPETDVGAMPNTVSYHAAGFHSL